jgi:ankyrin repeat protein
MKYDLGYTAYDFTEVFMAMLKAFSSNPRTFLVSVAALVLLAACGEHGSSKAPLVPAKESSAKAKLNPPCAYVAGRLNKVDAELFGASGEGDVRLVKQLIDAGRNVNATDSFKRTPLFAAAFCNRPEVGNLLIDKGSAVNAKDFLGMSPLHAAVLVGGSEAAKALISKGANINIRNTAGFTPLHLAAATNQIAMVELLLEHGANVQAHDLDGIAAASLASKNDHPLVVAAIKKLQEK